MAVRPAPLVVPRRFRSLHRTHRFDVAASVSQIFFFKSNAPSFSSFFIILLSYPLGKLSDRILPDWLNPGPFGKKEHMLVSLLTDCVPLPCSCYASSVVACQALVWPVTSSCRFKQS